MAFSHSLLTDLIKQLRNRVKRLSKDEHPFNAPLKCLSNMQISPDEGQAKRSEIADLGKNFFGVLINSQSASLNCVRQCGQDKTVKRQVADCCSSENMMWNSDVI